MAQKVRKLRSAWEHSELDRYRNAEEVADKGYENWQRWLKAKSKRQSKRFDLMLMDRSLGGLPTNVDFGEGFMFPMLHVSGGKSLRVNLFFTVAENLTEMSVLQCRSLIPWYDLTRTLIPYITASKTRFPKMPYIVSTRSGTDLLNAEVWPVPNERKAFLLRLYMSPLKESDGR